MRRMELMDNKLSMKEVTELLIQKLKDDIMCLQKQALSANQAGKHTECEKALRKQGQDIEALIKLVETYNRKF